MHHTIDFMAITAERQLLAAKAARGWGTDRARSDAAFVRPLLGRAVRALNSVWSIQTQTIHLPSNTDLPHQASAKPLIDLLPTE